MRGRNLHLALSGLCAVASVGLAAVQTFRNTEPAPPVEVRVIAPEPSQANASEVTTALKTDSVTVVTADDASFQRVAALDGAVFLPGTKPEQMNRYDVKSLFDGNPSSRVVLANGDSELDFIVQFPAAEGETVTGIELAVPADVPSEDAPLTIDIMVLPSGTMEGGGRTVTSFTVDAGKPVQTFPIEPVRGKGLWIHIANRQGAAETVIGDMRVFTSIVQ